MSNIAAARFFGFVHRSEESAGGGEKRILQDAFEGEATFSPCLPCSTPSCPSSGPILGGSVVG